MPFQTARLLQICSPIRFVALRLARTSRISAAFKSNQAIPVIADYREAVQPSYRTDDNVLATSRQTLAD